MLTRSRTRPLSTSAVVIIVYITGLVVVHKGSPLLSHIKSQGGFYRADAVGDLIGPKSWIIPCEDDEEAWAVAKFLKKQARDPVSKQM